MTTVPQEFAHGLHAYRTRGCRCDVCKTAKAADTRKYRAARKERLGAAEYRRLRNLAEKERRDRDHPLERRPSPPKLIAHGPREDVRSAIRAGYEDGDYRKFIEGVLESSEWNGECLEWQRTKNLSGYPTVRFGKKDKALHRLVIEVREGKPLGKLAAHHKCANTICVNPDHLQPVTHRENIAEMNARRSLEMRIQELEEALIQMDPGHPALDRVSHLPTP